MYLLLIENILKNTCLMQALGNPSQTLWQRTRKHTECFFVDLSAIFRMVNCKAIHKMCNTFACTQKVLNHVGESTVCLIKSIHLMCDKITLCPQNDGIFFPYVLHTQSVFSFQITSFGSEVAE